MVIVSCILVINTNLSDAQTIFKSIIAQCRQNHPTVDFSIEEKAFEFANRAHWGQKRETGEDYIFHCLAVAEILTNLKLGPRAISAALLHDVLEEGKATEQELEKNFGKEITELVKGVTKVGKIQYHGVERAIENLRKMFLAIAEDIRVVLIKLADRLHNMRTLAALPEEKQRRIAQETMDIYAPLADRLGIGKMRGELQDLAFQHLMPGDFFWLADQVKEKYEEREKYLEKRIAPLLKKELLKEKIEPVEIHCRAKHYYSLYQKLQRYEMNLSRVYDLVALRVIVNSIEECYAVLGVIHKLWRPLPGRIKDYIALPKPNGYQSIHTTVFCFEGKITEIQIRTVKMHEEAENGIAAHWHYSEKKGLRAYIKKILTPAPEKELKWIQQLRDWQGEISRSPDEFFRSLKIDFFKDRIFVFTPRGDIINLPEGATPVDFAYHIHSDIGHRCQGARGDGKMMALDTTLQNGQVVEIIAQKNLRPSRDWLKFVKTNLAKNRIRQWLNKNKIDFAPPAPEIKIKKEPIKPGSQKTFLAKPLDLKPIVAVAGDPKIATTLAKCCHPQPPDKIVGYVTLNQKITIHRHDCPNLSRLKDDRRFIRVNWSQG